MRLAPVTITEQPSYPSRHRVFAAVGSWARRAAGTALASSALVFGACYGSTPIDPGGGGGGGGGGTPVVPATVVDPPPGPFQPYVQLAGEMMAPSFTCSETRPEPPSWIDSWGYWESSLCGEETAWAFYEVTAEGPFRVGVDSGAESVSLALLQGEAELAVLDADQPSVELRLAPGLYTLAADPIDPIANPHDWFVASVTPLND